MNKLLTMLAVFVMPQLSAQELAGDWQGTLTAGTAKLRLILRIVKAESRWNGALFSIDQSPDWGLSALVESVSLQNGKINIKIADTGAYEGALSADGTSISGTWTQGVSVPLEFRRATEETEWKDPFPHTVQFVTVNGDVKLEVLDWGGAGRPVILLAGLGNSAHIFDRLSAKLRATYHVYGLTRRGFGASSAPASGYSADRLADDVLEVIDSLKLQQPVLAGHSIAGEELSSIGSRHPEKVAGLIYLDAGYSYAYYDAAVGQKDIGGPLDLNALPPIDRAIIAGGQKYTKIHGPVLALYAFGDAKDPASAEAQSKAFESGVPNAKVVRFPRASHFLFLTNEAIVLRQMETFIATLP